MVIHSKDTNDLIQGLPINVGRVTHPEVCDTVRSESWDCRESIMSLCVEADKGALLSVLLEICAKGLISCGISPGSSLTSAMKILLKSSSLYISQYHVNIIK